MLPTTVSNPPRLRAQENCTSSFEQTGCQQQKLPRSQVQTRESKDTVATRTYAPFDEVFEAGDALVECGPSR